MEFEVDGIRYTGDRSGHPRDLIELIPDYPLNSRGKSFVDPTKMYRWFPGEPAQEEWL